MHFIFLHVGSPLYEVFLMGSLRSPLSKLSFLVLVILVRMVKSAWVTVQATTSLRDRREEMHGTKFEKPMLPNLCIGFLEGANNVRSPS